MSVQDIVTIAMRLGGREGDEEMLTSLCQVAMDSLTGRLRSELSPEDCSPAFEIACAWMALEDLEGVAGGVTSFSAGDVSVQVDGGLGLRQRGERLMAPYLQEKGFAMTGVRG